tara:strand:- start:495 stop:842 length:348 start_codon:yes stop_codon:yes gene_type:complete
VTAAAVSIGSIRRWIGTLLIHPSWTSSTDLPVLWEIESAREPSLSVSVKPGRMLLIVMQGGNSLDMDLDHDAIAPLRVFERPMLSIGSLTDVEMIFTILPVPSDSIFGTRAFVIT